MPDELRELLLSYRDYYGGYHHHKEQMAYTAAALYLAGSSAVLAGASDMWAWDVPPAVLLTLLFSSLLGGFAFIVWQLRNRELAADMVQACTSVLTKLLSEPVNADAVRSAEYRGAILPQILVNELDKKGRKVWQLRGSRVSEAITYLLMVVWSVVAVFAVCRAA